MRAQNRKNITSLQTRKKNGMSNSVEGYREIKN